jgi:hypothetical protein
MRDPHRPILHTLAATAIIGLLVEACGGKTVTLGTNSVQSATELVVAPNDVSSMPTTQCASGAAHPNVCCKADQNTPASCRGYPDGPFHPCDPDRTLYPDPRRCCDLNDPTKCGAPPASPPPPPPGQCVYGCPIGWYAVEPITTTSGGCCSAPDSTGGGGCFGWGTIGSPLPASGPGPFPPFDGGTTGVCDYVCPDGWQPLTPSTPDTCCRSWGTDAGPRLECFSQATGPAQSVTSGGGSGGPIHSPEAGTGHPPFADAGPG